MNKKDTKTEEKNSKKNVIAITKGSVISIGISIILIFIMSVILTFSNVSETIIPALVIVISAISILVGSVTATFTMRRNGLVNGAIIGIVYISFIYILSSIMIADFNLNIKSLVMLVVSIITGMVGGIMGVNIRKN